MHPKRPHHCSVAKAAIVVPLLALFAPPVSAQESLWRIYIEDGNKAYAAARYAEAEKLFKLAVAEAEQFGPTDVRLAVSLNNLALLYDTQAKYDQAEPLHKRSLAIDEQALGPDHPDVATDLNNLAALYDDQGKYDQAEPLYKRSLAIREKALGPDHPDVATSLENYGILLGAMGRAEEGRAMMERAAAIRQRSGAP